MPAVSPLDRFFTPVEEDEEDDPLARFFSSPGDTLDPAARFFSPSLDQQRTERAPMEQVLADAQRAREEREANAQRTGEPFTPQAEQFQALSPSFPSTAPGDLTGLAQTPASTTRTQDIPDTTLPQQASIVPREGFIERGAATTIQEQPEDEDQDFMQAAMEWIAPVDPSEVGGLTAVAKNVGVGPVIGGVIGAFVQAGMSLWDLAAAGVPGKINPEAGAKATREALEHAKGFVEFGPLQLKNAAIMSGLGPDGWNPLVEIVKRKLAGDPMRMDELREKYPTFAAAGEELVAFPAGPAMALSMAKHMVQGKPAALQADITKGRFTAPAEAPKVQRTPPIESGVGRVEKYTQTRSDLRQQGYTERQADYLLRKQSDRAAGFSDIGSWTKARLAKEADTAPRLKGDGEATVYRAVPKGKGINAGDYVFLSRNDAVAFVTDFGKVRGQPNIVELTTPRRNLIVPEASSPGEAIYAPRPALKIPKPQPLAVTREPVSKGQGPPKSAQSAKPPKPGAKPATTKQPWEMTREEFNREFWFHGKGKGHPLFGKPEITGGVTKHIAEASGYADRGKGEIHLIRQRNLAIGARQELADVIRGQRALGDRKYKPDFVSGQGATAGGRVKSEFVIPASEKNPHRFLVEQARREGKAISAEVLKDYPDLRSQIGTSKKVTPAKPPPPVKPKPAVAKPEPSSETIALNKAEIALQREGYGLNKLPDPVRRRWKGVIAEVQKSGLDKRAIDIAEEVLGTKNVGKRRPISDTEHMAMILKETELANEYRAEITAKAKAVDQGNPIAAEAAQKRADGFLGQIEKLTEASDQAGTEAGRTLSIRRARVNRETYELAHVMIRAKASKGAKLSAAETKKIERLVQRIEVSDKALAEAKTKETEWLKERERLIADKVTAHEGRVQAVVRQKKSAQEKLATERANLEKELAKMGLTAKMGLDPQLAFTLGKYAVNLIRGGANTLEAVVKQVKAKYPELTNSDIYEALAARDPKRQAKARTDATKLVAELKTQGRLLNEIEKIEAGLFGAKKDKPQSSLEIKVLQKRLRDLRTQAFKSGMDPTRLERSVQKINELQDMLDHHYRAVKKDKPVETVELKALKQQMQELRKEMRIEDQLADLNEQLRTGEFVVHEKPVSAPISPRLERMQIELKKTRQEINNAVYEMSPLRKRVFLETAGLLRVMKATADMSAFARQGLILSLSKPGSVPKAFSKAAQAFFKEYTAEQIDAGIRAHPNYYLAERAKLELSELGGSLARREEMFASRWAEKIPGYKHIVKASERHMTTFLNMMRFDYFNKFLELHPNATTAELAAIADWVNVASGRGNLGALGRGKTGKFLTTVMFAPRFAVSRIQTPLMFFKHIKHPRVRKEIAKDYAKTLVFGVATLTMAKLAGAEVGLDPDSPDFGKIRIGGKDDLAATRIDVWAGLQQPARVVLRGIKGGLFGFEGNIDWLDLAGRFTSYKIGPIVRLPMELRLGKTAVGEKVTIPETLIKSVMPLFIEDTWDALRLVGPGAAVGVGAATFFGVGVTTYEDSERTVRERIRHLRDVEKDFDAARDLQIKWNKANPKNLIVLVKRKEK